MVNLYVPAPTIQNINPGPVSTPGLVTRDGELTVVIVACATAAASVYVQLPGGSPINDVVEMYTSETPSGWNITVNAVSGESIFPTQTANGNIRLRKITSLIWGSIS